VTPDERRHFVPIEGLKAIQHSQDFYRVLAKQVEIWLEENNLTIILK